MLYHRVIREKKFRSITAGTLLALFVISAGCSEKEGTGAIVDLKTIEKRNTTERVAPTPPPAIEKSFDSQPEKPVKTAVVLPEPPEEVTYEEAEKAFTEKRYDEAVNLFTQYTGHKSQNPWGFYMLGLSAWKSGNYEKAEEAFEQTLELDPLHVKSWLNWSRVLLEADRPKEALAKIDVALEIDPESNVAYRLQGRAYHQLGLLEEAIGAYRQAILMDNRDAWSMNNLGLIYIEEELFADALPPLARAVELRDDIAIFQNNLGMALERTGHYRSAGQAYTAATDLDGAYEKASLNLGRIESVVYEPAVEPIDLESLALGFGDEINGWIETVASKDELESAEAGGEVSLISEADSTENGLKP